MARGEQVSGRHGAARLRKRALQRQRPWHENRRFGTSEVSEFATGHPETEQGGGAKIS